MTDREILEKYIDVRDSCLDDSERKQVREMLYDYKDVFSLRDEIGMCLSIEVNIEVTDNSPFFIRPYHVKEEYRIALDKEMRRLCYLGISKEGFLAYSSTVMLILDLKDAFYPLRLPEKSQKYCGILPYFGSALYL